MAKVITIKGKYKSTRLHKKVEQLLNQGKKVYSSDNNFFFERTTPSYRQRVHKTYDVIVNVDCSAGRNNEN